jgi:hypothetical protein
MTVDPANDDSESLPISFPQPSKAGSEPYIYHRFDEIEQTYFPSLLEKNLLVWVLLSKGKKKTPQLSSRARVVSEAIEEEERVLVRYANGSTYRVRRSNLMPVLEHQEHIIIVASETNDYRRSAIVHTRSVDHFLEIGCDFGITTDSVQAASKVGVDKSEESIRIARERYPTCDFLLGDVFEDLEITPKNPLVVAMDINGNRELPAVLECIQVILDSWSPRVVVVKSRALYAQMVKNSI